MADTTELAASAAKVAPPVITTGLHIFGVPVAEWVMALTLVYTVLQIIILLRDKVFHIGPEEALHERIRRRIRKPPGK